MKRCMWCSSKNVSESKSLEQSSTSTYCEDCGRAIRNIYGQTRYHLSDNHFWLILADGFLLAGCKERYERTSMKAGRSNDKVRHA